VARRQGLWYQALLSNGEHIPLGDLARHKRFATTRWSLILAAGAGSGADASRALAELCSLYWYPLYAFIRRRGHPADQAHDLTQGLFARLLEKNELASLRQQRGRFRSWLLAAASHYLANVWNSEQAQKRGGGLQHFSIDGEEAEGRYVREAMAHESPERLFEREWVLLLLERVLATLRDEWMRAGKGLLFERLRGSLTGEQGELTYQQVGNEVGMTVGAVKVAAYRLRHRLRALLEAEVTQTLERPEEVEDELRALLASLG
jgi:RNA polymerase sigma-70 factor (ECF subfamily)